MTISEPRDVPPGVPANLITPTGNMPAIGVPNSQDYARLIFAAPYFEQIPIAEIIQPSVTEAVENALPSLIPPYVDAAVLAGVQQYSVLLTGSTMSGPLFLSPLMPTQPSQAATMAYVDAMLATAGIPEVPPVPQGQVWARETGQWVPISQSEGTFLPLAGGSMQGIINMSGNTITNMAAVPAMPNGAAPAQWVLNQIASVSLYQGTWDADTNAPDLTQLSVRVNGYTWIALTSSPAGVVIGPAIPGLQGMTIYNGDTIIYSTVAGQFQAIHAGGLTLPEADARYVQLAGSQMSGALLLNADATQNMQAVTYQQLEAAVANTVTPDAPADGQAYLRVGVGTNRWVPGLPLAGGILTGALTLAGNATTAMMPVPLQQMTSAITASTAGLLPIAGGTMTGPIVLNGNATTNLNPVPLQQLNGMLGSYLPLTGGTLSGNLTVQNSGGQSAYLMNTTNGPGIATGSLWRSVVATSGNYAIQMNTAAAGDFSTALQAYVCQPNGNTTVTGSLQAGALVSVGAVTAAGDVVATGVLQAGGTGGPYWQNAGGTMLCQQSVQTDGNFLNANGSYMSQFPGTTGGIILQSAGGGAFYQIITSGPDPVYQWNGGGENIMTLDSAGTLYIRGTLVQGSDVTEKERIEPITGGLELVRQLLPKRFYWKDREADQKEHWGFIAQDVESAIPAAVSGHVPSGVLCLEEMGIVAAAVAAIKELAARVEALEGAVA